MEKKILRIYLEIGFSQLILVILDKFDNIENIFT